MKEVDDNFHLPVSIFPDRHGDLGLDDGIDPTDLVGYLPRALKE